jgi:hypothetical protein
MLSKKDYKVIARVIKDNSVKVIDETTQDGEVKEYINKDNFIDDLTMYFNSDNNAFSWERFVNACEID